MSWAWSDDHFDDHFFVIARTSASVTDDFVFATFLTSACSSLISRRITSLWYAAS